MKIFLGLCGSCKNGFESSGRGEGRWAMSLARCLHKYGHDVAMAPDTEPAEWGTCKKPDNMLLLQPWEKNQLNDVKFDVAIFTSWQDTKPEAQYIHADKYIWGIMGWKSEIMKDGFFNDKEYVARWFRADLPEIPFEINFRDRCKLLAQPFGDKMDDSKFDNKKVAWVAKEAFADTTPENFAESGQRHLFGVIDACKKSGAALALFSCHEFDPEKYPKIRKYKIMEKLGELENILMYPNLSFPEYQKELQSCSVTIPLAFAGSIQESIFNGLVPLMYKDSMFSNHPWIRGVCNEMTNDKVSRFQNDEERKNVLSSSEISEIVYKLLTNRSYFNEYSSRLKPMVYDNIDREVHYQLQDIINHKSGGKK